MLRHEMQGREQRREDGWLTGQARRLGWRLPFATGLLCGALLFGQGQALLAPSPSPATAQAGKDRSQRVSLLNESGQGSQVLGWVPLVQGPARISLMAEAGQPITVRLWHQAIPQPAEDVFSGVADTGPLKASVTVTIDATAEYALEVLTEGAWRLLVEQ